jgi:hypothetical protein
MKSLINWKTVVAVVVVLLVLGPIARQLMSSGGSEKAVDTTGAGRASNQPTAAQSAPPATEVPAPSSRGRSGKTARPTTVNVDGQLIPTASQPTILLNPGLVRPGTKVAVSGFGFDAGGVVDVVLQTSGSASQSPVTLAKTDKNGSFTASFAMPEGVATRGPTVLARQRNSDKAAKAQAVVSAGLGSLKVGKQVGKPGDRVLLTGGGFGPGEDVKVYWGVLSGPPAQTLQADQSGNIGQASVRVPVVPVGNSTLALIGGKSQTVATSPFIVLGLYPAVTVSPYALRASNRVGFSGRGFGPDERVLVYVNSTAGAPVMTVQADGNGSFSGTGLIIPFGLKKQQSLILLGEVSRAVVSSGFLVLPYTPTAQPSTYGGAPGTSLTFYATGFAPNEVVLIYKHRTRDSAGELVGAFRADGRGRAAAAGQYMIAADQPGKLVFTLVGRKSEGVASASVQVQGSDVSAQVSPQPKFTLPADLQDQPSPSAAAPGASHGAVAPPSSQPAASGGGANQVPAASGSPASSP